MKKTLFVVLAMAIVLACNMAYAGQVWEVDFSTRNMDDGTVVQKLSFKADKEVTAVHIWSDNDQKTWIYEKAKCNKTKIRKGKLTGVWTYDSEFAEEKSWSVKLDQQYCYTGWYYVYVCFADGDYADKTMYVMDAVGTPLPQFKTSKVELVWTEWGDYLIDFPSYPYNGTSQIKLDYAWLIYQYQYYQCNMTVKVQFAFEDHLFVVNAPVMAGQIIVPGYIIGELKKISPCWKFSVQTIYSQDLDTTWGCCGSYSIRQYSDEVDVYF